MNENEVSALTARLEEIKKRCDAATPGPWSSVSDCDKSAIKFGRDIREHIVESANHHYPEGFGQKYGGVVHSWDAEFIAASREDVPFLLSALRTLLAEKQALEAHERALLALCDEAKQQADKWCRCCEDDPAYLKCDLCGMNFNEFTVAACLWIAARTDGQVCANCFILALIRAIIQPANSEGS